MKRKVVGPRRKAELQAEALIERMALPESKDAPELTELLAALPHVLESALGYLLSEFDYDANPHSNTAIGMRLLATAADRFRRLQTRSLV